MTNHTPAPEDEYDVLIEGDLDIDGEHEMGKGHQYDPKILSAQLVPQLYATVFAVGLLDNILVVLILLKCKGLRHVENIYFLNLTVSNLCFLLTLPFWIHTTSQGGILGGPACRVVVGFSSVGLHSEALFSVFLVVQRYRVFFKKRRFSMVAKTVPSILVTSAIVWVTVILISLPEFIFYKPGLEGQKYNCFFSIPHSSPVHETFWKYWLILKMNVLGFLFPLLVFIFCYLRMKKTLRFREKKYELYKLVFAIMAVFLLMWGPYNVALFLSTFREPFSLQDWPSSFHLDRAVHITKIIATTHCCVNPLLYVMLEKSFRMHLCHRCVLCGDTPAQATLNSAEYASREEYSHSTEV